MSVFSCQYEPDDQGNEKGECDRYQVGGQSQDHLQLIFRCQRRDQVLQDCHARRETDQYSRNRQPQVLSDEQAGYFAVFKTDHLQRRQLPVSLGIAHYSEVVEHNRSQNHRSRHQQDNHGIHQIHEGIKGVHDRLFALCIEDHGIFRNLRLVCIQRVDCIADAGILRALRSHDDAFAHGKQDPRYRHSVCFIAVIGGERHTVSGRQGIFSGYAGTDIRSPVMQRDHFHVLPRKTYLVMGNGIDLQIITLVADLHAALGAPVCLQLLSQLLRFFIGNGFRVQVDAFIVVDGLIVKGIDKGIHGVHHAHAPDQQHHAADNAEKRHEGP